MESETLQWTITILLLLMLLLSGAALYAARCRMARVCNWNGRRYCYLGYVPIRREKGNFVIRIGEHMTDLAHTADYRICPGRAFVRKNRYRGLVVYAEGERRYLVIEDGVSYFFCTL
ncbi:MAG: hypothetical protein NC341_05165 [Blautia sp.]|nr:hypothetical protein [Blautia sp.]MCM1199663.1 hypothetical protein [Bacteroides fragilis]